MKENTCPVFTYTIKDRLKYTIFNEVNSVTSYPLSL